MAILSAVDFGYGYTKAISNVDGKTSKTSIPTVVAPSSQSMGFERVLGGNRQEKYRVAIDGAEMLIGDSAIEAGGTRTMGERAVDRPYMREMVLASCVITGAAGDVTLGLGVPLAMFATQQREVSRMFKNMSASVVLNKRPPVPIKVSDVFVFPQGGGAYLAELARDPQIIKHDIAVIDVGFFTTDLLVFHKGQPREALSTSITVGMRNVYLQMSDGLRGHLGTAINTLRLETMIREGDMALSHFGKPIDMLPHWEKSLQSVAEQIIANVREKWGDDLAFLNRILLTGGGGKALYPYMQHLHPTLEAMQNASFSNAEGYLKAISRKR